MDSVIMRKPCYQDTKRHTMDYRYILSFVIKNAERFQQVGEEAMDVYNLLESLYQDFVSGQDGRPVMSRTSVMEAVSNEELLDILADLKRSMNDPWTRDTFSSLRPKPKRGIAEILQLVIVLWPLIKQIIDKLNEGQDND